MKLSGFYRTASGSLGGGTVTFRQQGTRQAAAIEVEADDRTGEWESPDLAPGTWLVTQADGWSTQVIGSGDIGDIQRSRASAGQADYIYVGAEDGPQFLPRWGSLSGPFGDQGVRFRREGGLVVVDGLASFIPEDEGDRPGQFPAFTLPVGFRPSRYTFLGSFVGAIGSADDFVEFAPLLVGIDGGVQLAYDSERTPELGSFSCVFPAA